MHIFFKIFGVLALSLREGLAAPDPCARYDVKVIRTVDGRKFTNKCAALCVPSEERDENIIHKVCKDDPEIGDVRTLCSDYLECRQVSKPIQPSDHKGLPTTSTLEIDTTFQPAVGKLNTDSSHSGFTKLYIIIAVLSAIILTLIIILIARYKRCSKRKRGKAYKHVNNQDQPMNNTAIFELKEIDTKTTPIIKQPQDSESDKFHVKGRTYPDDEAIENETDLK
ncbi:unnamed protein product [Owenia fusiformis]|uniref:Uncharacterized protein n=1 Tax=Owenia fusiformis TaxID=6347 RepID=A0A8S4P6B4_OWEFU|nr:unnamed protein product [Owenia fusiformis]